MKKKLKKMPKYDKILNKISNLFYYLYKKILNKQVIILFNNYWIMFNFY